MTERLAIVDAQRRVAGLKPEAGKT
jgi:hypothetical protein